MLIIILIIDIYKQVKTKVTIISDKIPILRNLNGHKASNFENDSFKLWVRLYKLKNFWIKQF